MRKSRFTKLTGFTQIHLDQIQLTSEQLHLADQLESSSGSARVQQLTSTSYRNCKIQMRMRIMRHADPDAAAPPTTCGPSNLDADAVSSRIGILHRIGITIRIGITHRISMRAHTASASHTVSAFSQNLTPHRHPELEPYPHSTATSPGMTKAPTAGAAGALRQPTTNRH